VEYSSLSIATTVTGNMPQRTPQEMKKYYRKRKQARRVTIHEHLKNKPQL
jgi:hypothetical protein